MISYRRIASGFGLLAASAAIAAVGAAPLLVSGADHLDAPTTKANHRIDITDIYAFKSDGGTTLVLNVNPLTSPADTQDRPLRYERAVRDQRRHATSTVCADIVYRIKFGSDPLATRTAPWSRTTRSSRATGAAARIHQLASASWSAVGTTTSLRRHHAHRARRRRRQVLRRPARRPVLLRPPGLRRVQEAAPRRLDGPGRPPRWLHRGRHVQGHQRQLDRDRGPELRAWAAPARPSACGRPRPCGPAAATTRSSGWAARRSTRCSTTRTPRRKPPTGSAHRRPRARQGQRDRRPRRHRERPRRQRRALVLDRAEERHRQCPPAGELTVKLGDSCRVPQRPPPGRRRHRRRVRAADQRGRDQRRRERERPRVPRPPSRTSPSRIDEARGGPAHGRPVADPSLPIHPNPDPPQDADDR